MPILKEHQRCVKRLLGKSNPLVHRFLDYNVRLYGRDHRKFTHHYEYIKMLGRLLEEDVKNEAVLHILQDWGMITKDDYKK